MKLTLPNLKLFLEQKINKSVFDEYMHIEKSFDPVVFRSFNAKVRQWIATRQRCCAILWI